MIVTQQIDVVKIKAQKCFFLSVIFSQLWYNGIIKNLSGEE